tara:strand:- start:45 stop:167 length:123 start_codon:yes stop_codon:yes gene_type:complete
MLLVDIAHRACVVTPRRDPKFLFSFDYIVCILYIITYTCY